MYDTKQRLFRAISIHVGFQWSETAPLRTQWLVFCSCPLRGLRCGQASRRSLCFLINAYMHVILINAHAYACDHMWWKWSLRLANGRCSGRGPEQCPMTAESVWRCEIWSICKKIAFTLNFQSKLWVKALILRLIVWQYRRVYTVQCSLYTHVRKVMWRATQRKMEAIWNRSPVTGRWHN